MRIVVFSDSHGNVNNILQIITMHIASDMFIFLGDMDRDIGIVKCKYPDKFICAVSGNNEFTPEYEDIKTINTPKLKIMYTHGHNHGVKFSTDKLYGEAVMQNCKLALYGHTHIQEIEIVDDVYIMCPGAVMNGDYLILDIIDDKIIYSFANINSKERLY